MKNRLQSKILLWLIIIIASIGAFVSIVVYSRLRSILLDTEKMSVHNTNIKNAKQLELVLNNTSLFVKMLATRLRVTEYLQSPTDAKRIDLTDSFDTLQRDNLGYLSIYLMDATGSAHISTDRSFIGNNYAFRPYFKEAIRGHSFVDAALGKTTNKVGLYFSYPVTSPQGVIIGVVAVKVEPKTVYREAHEDGSSGRKSTVMITDSLGIILFSTKQERELKSIGGLSSVQQVRLKENVAYSSLPISSLWYDEAQSVINNYSQPETKEIQDKTDSEYEMISIAKVKGYPFYYVEEVGLDAVLSNINAISSLLGFGIFFAALASIFIISIIIRRALSPLKVLERQAQLIGEGNFTEKITVRTGDELEELGTLLNTTQGKLRESYQGLQDKVEVRTGELKKQLNEVELTKKAMLNILEDVNMQKEKIEHHAIELQKFKLAVENVHDHIVITDPNGIILYANKAVERITGYTRDEILSQKAGNRRLWGGYSDKKTYEAFWKCIKIDKKNFTGEFINQRKNGEKYMAEAHVSPILDAKGNVLFFVGIERDITKAKEIDRMKTEFISLASHQLRTPLSAMRWFLEMLLNGDAGTLTKEQSEFVANVEQSNNRMIELVNSLLNVSRIESGRIIIEPIPTDLKKLVEEVKKEVLVKIEGKKQQLIINIHSDLPSIQLDQKLIRQVFINLLTNAIKYSPPNSEIYIFISKENDTIITQISDSGYGIPLAEQDRIFTKFYRATNAIKRETEGNGLGLYLVKSIVESSGGRIWFESDEKKGSSFFFTIPMTGMVQKTGEVRMS